MKHVIILPYPKFYLPLPHKNYSLPCLLQIEKPTFTSSLIQTTY
jgi:hypothetical protein